MNDTDSKVHAADLNDLLVGCTFAADHQVLGTITGIVHAHGRTIVQLDTGWLQLLDHQPCNLNLEFVR